MTLMRWQDSGEFGHGMDVLYRTGDKAQLGMHSGPHSQGVVPPNTRQPPSIIMNTCELPLVGGSSARIFSPHAVQDLRLHLAQFFDWRFGRSVKGSDFHLGCGCRPLEQVCIHGFGRAVHVVEYGDEPLKPEQVPGDF